MPRSIQCNRCGVILNVPAQAEGRRLKCPKCGEKFLVDEGGVKPPLPPTHPGGSSPDSTFILSPHQLGQNNQPNRPWGGSAPPEPRSNDEIPVMPTAAGDLRETFDLPLMTDTSTPATAGARPGADALALFTEKPAAPRRKTGAEARATARRCPTCGGVVPQGMSLCNTCGLDLDTGNRVDLLEDLSPPPSPRAQGAPIPIVVLGGICLAVSLALAVVALVQSQGGMPGAIYFAPLALFGTYASVQFLRGKSAKLLMVALTLGAMIDLAGLVVMPIVRANTETSVSAREVDPNDPDSEDQVIHPVAERLDSNRLSLGITLLFLYAVVSIYLVTPKVQRHFRK